MCFHGSSKSEISVRLEAFDIQIGKENLYEVQIESLRVQP